MYKKILEKVFNFCEKISRWKDTEIPKISVVPKCHYSSIGACDSGFSIFDFGCGMLYVIRCVALEYNPFLKTISKKLRPEVKIIERFEEELELEKARIRLEISQLKQLKSEILLYDGSLYRIKVLFPELWNELKKLPIVGVIKDSKAKHLDGETPDYILAMKLSKNQYFKPVMKEDFYITCYRTKYYPIKVEIPKHLDFKKIIETLMFLSQHSYISYPLPLHLCDLISKFSAGEHKLIRKSVLPLEIFLKRRKYK
jgi:hypothetical protein